VAARVEAETPARKGEPLQAFLEELQQAFMGELKDEAVRMTRTFTQ
jgi:hypothetical protein